MPNWCSNELTIVGPLKTVADFVLKAVGYGPWQQGDEDRKLCYLNFHSFVPVPDDVLNCGKNVIESYNLKGYEWEHENWGVKWGANSESVSEVQRLEDGSGKVEYDFDTPWGPALKFFDKVAAMYPELSFELEYREEGMELGGRNTWKGGRRTESVLFDAATSEEEGGDE